MDLSTDFNSVKLGLARDIIKLVAGALIAKGLVGEGFFTDARIEVLAGILLAIGMSVWSAWRKRMVTKAVEVAITMPADSTVQDVKDKLQEHNRAA